MTTKRSLTPREEIQAIRSKLKRLTFEATVKEWLDTGSPRLNTVLGSAVSGIPFGKIIEMFGEESSGKTMLSLFLAGKAQSVDADVAWIDLENSWDSEWVQNQGVDPEKVYLFQLAMIRIPNKKTGKTKMRLQTAEECLEEAEEWMRRRYRLGRKMLMVVDSVAAILPDTEAKGGITEQTMQTNFALSRLMGHLLRRWVALAASYGCTIIFINQIRIKPGVVYGDPETTPGGRALKFYSSIRVKVRRAGKGRGRILQNGIVVGLKGIVTNIKNKAGGGSVEGASTGFIMKFNSKTWKFLSAKEAKGD